LNNIYSDGVKFNNPVLAAVVVHDSFNTDHVRYVDMNGNGRSDLMYQGKSNEFWYYEAVPVGFSMGIKVADLPSNFTGGSSGYDDIDGDAKAGIVY
jgi:hypothetical protein